MRVFLPYFGDEVKDIVEVVADMLLDDPYEYS